jgi:hypothetical protein
VPTSAMDFNVLEVHGNAGAVTMPMFRFHVRG